MSPESQRIAIAEVCGWKWIEPEENKCGGLKSPSGDWVIRSWRIGADMTCLDVLRELPDFLNDLNAMHRAEETLSELNKIKYVSYLLTCREIKESTMWVFSHAGASVRAKAFLKTLGLWKEEQVTLEQVKAQVKLFEDHAIAEERERFKDPHAIRRPVPKKEER